MVVDKRLGGLTSQLPSRGLTAQPFTDKLVAIPEPRHRSAYTTYAASDSLVIGEFAATNSCLNRGGRRVAPGGYPPEAPTDPDMRISRIRLLRIMDSLRDGKRSGPLAPAVMGIVPEEADSDSMACDSPASDD